ncbi:transporter [Lacinutrix neustonica]|uniref:Transporter n=1 Tax=Lacinutrix neustonica TaxID=2980107 RepID=A0A9E8MVY3_9FLAO|nr:transporter [Lacinutrix neustonica]WAC02578.1 transporter [Lacinutrix neustonica]
MFLEKRYLTLLVFAVCISAHAQYTEVINSNRPGVSRSAFSVGTNVVQFEAGPFTVKEEHTPLKYNVEGFGVDFAARYGLLFPQLEINLEGSYQNDTKTDFRSSISNEVKRSNFKHVTLGAKYLIYDPYKNREDNASLYSYHANKRFQWSSLIPAVAVYVGANFDSKDNPYTAPGVEGFSPKVMIATQNNFSSGWVFIMNFSKDRIGSDDSDFQYILTLTKAISEQWVLFGETQGIKSDFYADNLFRFGGAYLWSKNFQLDTALTFNTKDTPSVFGVNPGVSYRLDFHKDPSIDNGTSAEATAERRANKKRKKKKDNKDLELP